MESDPFLGLEAITDSIDRTEFKLTKESLLTASELSNATPTSKLGVPRFYWGLPLEGFRGKKRLLDERGILHNVTHYEIEITNCLSTAMSAKLVFRDRLLISPNPVTSQSITLDLEPGATLGHKVKVSNGYFTCNLVDFLARVDGVKSYSKFMALFFLISAVPDINIKTGQPFNDDTVVYNMALKIYYSRRPPQFREPFSVQSSLTRGFAYEHSPLIFAISVESSLDNIIDLDADLTSLITLKKVLALPNTYYYKLLLANLDVDTQEISHIDHIPGVDYIVSNFGYVSSHSQQSQVIIRNTSSSNLYQKCELPIDEHDPSLTIKGYALMDLFADSDYDPYALDDPNSVLPRHIWQGNLNRIAKTRIRKSLIFLPTATLIPL